MGKSAKILYDGVLAARLSATDEGYLLEYNEHYLQQQDSKAISLTLPKKPEAYTSKVLFPFFDGLIPEGWLLDIAIDYWKVKANERFELLFTTCRDTIGAVTVQPE